MSNKTLVVRQKNQDLLLLVAILYKCDKNEPSVISQAKRKCRGDNKGKLERFGNVCLKSFLSENKILVSVKYLKSNGSKNIMSNLISLSLSGTSL